MEAFMRALPALFLTLPLAAQGPALALGRTTEGLKALNVGRWEDALRAWSREGYLGAEELLRLQGQLQALIPSTRAVGGWAPFRKPLTTELWERHFLTVSFEEGAVFLVFDWIQHRAHWRLQRLQVVQDPTLFLRGEPAAPAEPR
jgi:hypothetical protein